MVKIHWCLLKLSSGNEIWKDLRQTDGWMDRQMDVQRETIIPHHYRVAGYKKVGDMSDDKEQTQILGISIFFYYLMTSTPVITKANL